MLQHGIDGIRAHLATLPPMREQSVEEARQMYDKARYVFALPDGVEVERDEVGGVPAEIVTPAEHGAGVLLYLHGGGYAIGSPVSHRHLVAALAAASRTRAFALDYRRAPEHPFPAAVDDALAGYRGLLEHGNRSALDRRRRRFGGRRPHRRGPPRHPGRGARAPGGGGSHLPVDGPHQRVGVVPDPRGP